MNFIKKSVSIITFIFFINAGFQSTSSDDKPAINFFGTIQSSGQIDEAENILIGDNYEKIKFYYASQPSDDPRANATELRLDDIQTITTAIDPTSKIPLLKKFHGIEYVTVIIEFKNGTKKEFLIEKNRKISYEMPFEQASNLKALHREIRIDALQILTIKNFKQRPRETQPQKNQKKSAAKDALCKEALKNIELEKQQCKSSGTIKKIEDAIQYLCG